MASSGFQSGFQSNWTGASGIQIGYAGEYPQDKYDSFTADEVHANPVNPNQPNQYRQKGSIGDVPTNIQSDNDFVDYSDGTDGYVLDNIDMPAQDDDAGTDGHESTLGPALARGRDGAHRQEVHQDFPAPGWSRDFYGTRFDTEDLHAWHDDSFQAVNTKSSVLDARYYTENWPTPFDSTKPAPLLPAIRSTDHIPMRRMKQDDRPMYRQVALPGANILPSGSVYNPQLPSNEFIQTRTPIPGSYSIPVDPSVSQDALSQSVMDDDSDYVSVGEWV